MADCKYPKHNMYGYAIELCDECMSYKKDKRIAELEAALERYGRHENHCEMWATTGASGQSRQLNPFRACSCGLWDVLKGRKEGE